MEKQAPLGRRHPTGYEDGRAQQKMKAACGQRRRTQAEECPTDHQRVMGRSPTRSGAEEKGKGKYTGGSMMQVELMY
jgi:hypothetical protein